MWIMVYFDLPTETPEDKLNYTRFRKSMLKDGFTMHQFSIYKRFCVSFESATTHVQRTKQNLPPYGHVSILVITDKQFGLMQNFYNAHPAKPHETPDQIALF